MFCVGGPPSKIGLHVAKSWLDIFLFARCILPRQQYPYTTPDERCPATPPTTVLSTLLYLASMCGVGTIPFLGASWFPKVFLLGGEVDDDAIDHLRGNGRSVRRSTGPTRAAGAAAACAWDAQCLPLRDSSVDAMVVDM